MINISVAVDEFIEVGKGWRIFPLFTKADLAARWGITRQAVNQRAKAHNDFCKSLDILAGGGEYAGGGPVYPLYEVERYENSRRLRK